MSDSSQVQLRRIIESTLGTTPGTAFTDMRFTGEGLNFNVANIASQEIRNDRQIPDLVQTGADASGTINFELSYGTYDNELEGALYDTFGSTLTVTDTDISAANSDNSFNSAGSGFPAFSVGQWIRVAGFTTNPNDNNGYFQVVTATSAKIVVTGSTLVDESAGDSVTIDGTMIRNGTTRRSFSIEKEFTDVTQFILYRGMVINTMTLNFQTNQILTGTFDYLGLSSAIAQTTFGTGSPTAASTSSVYNAVGNVANIREGGSLLAAGIYIQTLTLQVTNTLRPQDAIGTLGHIGIGTGRLNVTGSMVAYFEDETLYEKYVNGTESQISFSVEDAAGNAYMFTVPRVKFATTEVVAGGIDQDVLANMTYQGIRHATYDATIQIDKFAAP